MSFVVTVDGPAASGKTSVSRELARRLGWRWVSTGAFYRGLAYAAHKLSMSPSDSAGLVKLIKSKEWAVVMSHETTKVLFRGVDVTGEIFQEAVGNMASKISQVPEVRKNLLEPQRQCAKAGDGLIAEGRDCGTVVFPEAAVKVYLTAASEARALRRAIEQNQSAEAIMEAQKSRDTADSTRAVAPMKAAEGALIVDTSDLTLDQVVDRIEEVVRHKLSKVGVK